MRLLVSSDWHGDSVTLGVPRRAELLLYLEALKAACVRERVDVAVFPGDLADPGGMLASLYASDAIRELFELAESTVLGTAIAVAGNHDVYETSRVLTTLSPVVAAAEVLNRYTGKPRVIVAERPALHVVSDVAFLLLPYVARAASADAVVPAGVLAFSEAKRLRDAGTKLVSVSHLNVPGARLGSESKEMARGRDVDLPVEALLALRPNLVINGHYHEPQVVNVGGLEVVIPGSPLSHTTDDPAAGKGYVLVEV